MVPNWKRSKGMSNVCYKCDGCFSDDDFDLQEDMCFKCLFPQMGDSLPVMFDKKYGDKRNTTAHAEILVDLEYRPTKQSIASKKAKRDFDWKNYSKKG